MCYFGIMRHRSESAMEKQTKELQEEFTAYRENVNQHFQQTANLVNDLTENYISVQKHLETAATSFAEPPKSFTLDENDTEKLPAAKPEFNTLEVQSSQSEDEEDAEFADKAFEPPLDYAPKGSKEQGTLEEGFRLQEKTDTPSAT